MPWPHRAYFHHGSVVGGEKMEKLDLPKDDREKTPTPPVPTMEGCPGNPDIPPKEGIWGHPSEQILSGMRVLQTKASRAVEVTNLPH